MDVVNVGAASGYQYQPKTANDLKEEVKNTPDSEIKDLGVIVEISKDTPEAAEQVTSTYGKQAEEKINKVNSMIEFAAKQVKIEQERFYKEHGRPITEKAQRR